MEQFRNHLFYILVSFLLLTGILPAQNKFLESRQQVTSTTSIDVLAGFRRAFFEGYTQSPSVNAGGNVEFMISTLAAYTPYSQLINPISCSMKIYRVTGTDRSQDEVMPDIFQIPSVTFYPLHNANNQPIYPEDSTEDYSVEIFPVEYKTGCSWPVAFSYTIPSYFPSGFYYAKLYLPGQEDDLSKTGYIPFVVKAKFDDTENNTLCVIAWNTYQAYNYWGGGSLYWWTGAYDTNYDGSAIETVSFRRPMGWHTHDGYPSSTQFGHLDMRERAFIAWAENNGYHMGYCVDSDINDGTILHNQSVKTICIPGHSEYWPFDERMNIELTSNLGFKGNGGHLAFYASNNCYWKVEYQSGTAANPDNMTCFKDITQDAPLGRNLWRYQLEGPEAKFIGVQFEGVNNNINISNIVQESNHWVFRGTSLKNGDHFGLGGNGHDPVAAGESDMVLSGFSPSNTVILGEVFIRTLDSSEAIHNEVTDIYSDVTFYEDISTNSRVFAAGGMGWSGCLFGSDATVMRTMTTNIQDHFNGKKFIGNVYTDQKNHLTWRTNIQLDGYVNVLAGKYLVIDGINTPTTVQIDSALNVYGNLEIKGNVTFLGTGNINIMNGGVLTIGQGSQINFNSGSPLIVNGRLDANGLSSNTMINFNFPSNAGAIVFDGSSSPASSLNFVNISNASEIRCLNGTNVTIQHCILKNCTNGIYIYSSAPTIRNNTIDDPYNNGIYGEANGRSPLIQGNTIKKVNHNVKNFQGIYLLNSTSPYITGNDIKNFDYGIYYGGGGTGVLSDGSSNYISRNNRLTNNYRGLTVAWGSYLTAGTPSYPFRGGSNSIYANTTADAYAYQNGTILAYHNWWGSDGAQTMANNGGVIYATMPLTSDPWVSIPLSKLNAGLTETSNSSGLSANSTEVPFSDIYTGISLEEENKIEEAVNHYKQMVEKESHSGFALSSLAKIYYNSKKDEIKDYFKALRSRKRPGDRIKASASNFLAGMYLDQNDYEGAMGIYDEIIKELPDDYAGINAKFEKFFSALHYKKDLSTARAMLDEIKSLKSDDNDYLMRLAVAEYQLNGASGNNLKKAIEDETNKITQAELFNNYPNPFNPVTVISYQIPIAGKVSLKVYDVLGKEVASLVDEYKNEGKYSVQFNASSLPSGMYIYEIRANNFIRSGKMLLLK